MACFVKQLGARPYERVNISSPGIDEWDDEPLKLRDPKGGDISEFPPDLRIREFPRTEG